MGEEAGPGSRQTRGVRPVQLLVVFGTHVEGRTGTGRTPDAVACPPLSYDCHCRCFPGQTVPIGTDGNPRSPLSVFLWRSALCPALKDPLLSAPVPENIVRENLVLANETSLSSSSSHGPPRVAPRRIRADLSPTVLLLSPLLRLAEFDVDTRLVSRVSLQ
jgi:hypothetical protein